MSDLTDVLDDPDISALGDLLELATLTVTTVTAAADSLTITAHGRATGDGPVHAETTSTLPDGYEADTDYYAIVIDANTIKLAESVADAIAGTAVAIADAGTGTMTLVDPGTAVRPYLVTRQAAGTRTLGVYTAGATTTVALGMSSIQPQQGANILVGPEGQTGPDVQVVYTRTALRTRRTGIEPDLVSFRGETWAVFAVQDWPAHGGRHYVAHVARQAIDGKNRARLRSLPHHRP